MRVAVIGAGIVGAAVARELAARGADVTVLDQTRPGAGTSGTTFAWVNSHGKEPDSYHRLNVAGCEEHRRLAESTAAADWYTRNGNLEWAGDGPGWDRLEKRVERLAAIGYACRWIDPVEARGLEPDLLLPDDVDRLAYFPDEAHVLPTLLLGRLLGEAQDHGAAVRWPVRVESVDASGDAAEVVFGTGDRERFDRVVGCVGRWTEQLTADSGARLPLVDPEQPGGAAVGYLAYTAPVPVRLGRILTTPRLNLRPDGGGRLVLQGLDLDATADPARVPDADSDIAAELGRRLHGVLDAHGEVLVEEVRVGQRAMPADGLTVAGFADGVGGAAAESLYVVATHSGITLGPLLGRLVASEVFGGDESALLGDFRPGRFADAQLSDDAVRAARLPGDQ